MRVVSVSRGGRRNHVIEVPSKGTVGVRCRCNILRPARGAERPGRQRHLSRAEGHTLVAVQGTGAVQWLQGGDGGGLRRDGARCGVSGGHDRGMLLGLSSQMRCVAQRAF